MQGDFSKFFLFMVLSLVVLVMVTDQRRPLAAAPIDPDTPTGDSQDISDRSMLTSRQFANVASNGQVPPLSLMMPETGSQPYDGA